MAKAQHLQKLRDGREAWNKWRIENRLTVPDLRGAPLSGWNLQEFDLRDAWLQRADLTNTEFSSANLARADLTGAKLSPAFFRHANLLRAKLRDASAARADLGMALLLEADLSGADFTDADFRHAMMNNVRAQKTIFVGAHLGSTSLWMADLRQADLSASYLYGAALVGANLEGANLKGSRVYGLSVWDAKLTNAVQSELIITRDDQPIIQVDNLEIAQFIYILLNNQRIRDVIDTITSKVVLILGRFTPERKAILDALREELRKRGYVPILFDFEKPTNQTTDETVSTLAHMARFVIADLTDAKSVLQELRAIVPNSPSVAVQPLILASREEPGMFDFYRQFQSVLPPFRYENEEALIAVLDEKVISPAVAKGNALSGKKDEKHVPNRMAVILAAHHSPKSGGEGLWLEMKQRMAEMLKAELMRSSTMSVDVQG